MKTASLVFGILAIIGMFIGFIPCFGSLNWVNIPFAAIGLTISIVAFIQSAPGEPRSNATSGIVLCSIAIFLGLIRLIIGFGIF